MLEKNKTRGITLISLVITVIILLILSLVAINLATDEDGLFKKAGEAVDKWNNKVAQEEEALKEIEAMLNEINGSPSTGEEEPEKETIAVESISLNSSTANVKVGVTVTLTATISPSNATNRNISWTSNSENVTVNANGEVTGVSAGTATITATTEDGSKTATCEITVENRTIGEVYSQMIGQSVTYSANNQEEWIILGEDTEKNGNVLITTKLPIQNGFEVYGSAEKWLSYVEDMHAVCSKYGGTIGGVEVEARSITIKDINVVTGFEEPEFDTYTFGTIGDYGNKRVNYIYPKAGSTWENFLGWKAPSIENETVFDNNWYHYNESVCTWEEGEIDVSEMIKTEKADLIWGTNNEFTYYVATTTVRVYTDWVTFDIARVSEGITASGYQRYCHSNAGSVLDLGRVGNVPVRPVVSVPSYVPVEEVKGVYDFVQFD